MPVPATNFAPGDYDVFVGASSDNTPLTKGGIKSLYDKRQEWEALRTDKFDGGEVLQFSAPGNAWEDPERVTMEAFDRTSRHDFPFKALVRSPVRTSAVRESQFEHFRLRESFHLCHELYRLDIDLEILNWDGTPERELRVALPIKQNQIKAVIVVDVIADSHLDIHY